MRIVVKVLGILSLTLCFVVGADFFGSDRDSDAQTPPPPLKVRPTLPGVKAPADFSPPENAYDGPATSAAALVIRHCKDFCSGETFRQTDWSGFPAGYRPQRLVVNWRADSTAAGLVAGDTMYVRATIMYKIGTASWEVLDMFESTGTASINFHDAPYTLPANTDSASIQVRATLETDLQCNGNPCNGPSHAGGSASVADIWLEVTPVLTIQPASPVRGDMVELKVDRVPEGAVSNWKYQPTGLTLITRDPSSTATTWPGLLVVTGTATANGVVPATAAGVGQQLYSLSLPVTVTARTGWFSTPANPEKKNPGTPAPPRCPTGVLLNVTDPEFCQSGGPPGGIGKSRVCFNWEKADDPEQLADNGPNHGIWWLPTFTDLTSYHWAVHSKIDPGNPTYCANQCGTIVPHLPNSACSTGINDVVTTCQLLKDAIARHEAGTVQNSHWVQYVNAQNDPSRNFKVGAESIVGAKELSLTGFQNTVENAISARELAIRNLTASPEPCLSCSENCGEFWGYWTCRFPPNGAWRWTCQ